MAKVSIIVPVYNVEKYLEKCLNSLVNQTLKDIEIILVDDGSTDNSKNIIKKFKDKRIKYIYQENSGQADARNKGLKNATGEYIVFVDSDDYVDLDMCEKLYKTIFGKYDIVVCDYLIDDNNIEKYNKIFSNKTSNKITPNEYLFSAACPWNKIYRIEFLLQNNFEFPSGIIYEDYASILALSKYNPNCFYLDKAFYHYVFHDNSTMRKLEYNKKYEDIFKANDILYNKLIDSGLNDELEYIITYHLLYLGSLNFYKYSKFEKIDQISNFMKERFPKWRKNKYLKKNSLKEKVLMKLFYYKKYGVIKFIQKLKSKIN